MRSNARGCFAFVVIVLVGLLAGCGNKTPTVQIISPQDDAVLANNTVHFTAVAEDPDSDPLTYKWSFGDGSTSAVQSVSHTYAAGGDYTINLAVSDSKHTVQTSTEIHINIRPSSKISWKVGEDAEWDSGTIEGTAPLHLEFDRSTSCDVDGQIVSYDWIFHDGTTASGPSSEYSYYAPGHYSVKLRVVDDLSASSEQSIEVVIHPSLAQSLETVRSLELLLSPLRSDVLTTIFPFSSELLHVQSDEVRYQAPFAGTHTLQRAMHDKIHGCGSMIDADRLSDIMQWYMRDKKRECELIRSSISPAFAAALACHETGLLSYCTPADSAKAVLGFEELVALTTLTAPGSHCVQVFSGSGANSILQLDTTKLPGALLQLPTSFVSELDRLGKEFASFLTTEQQRIDRLVKGDLPPPGWGEAEWAWATKHVRCIDEATLVSSVEALAAHLDMLNTEYKDSLQQIKNTVRDHARCEQGDAPTQPETYQDQLRFGVVFDNFYSQRNYVQLALVYSFDVPGEGSRPMEFALFHRGNTHIVRVLPHSRIETPDLQYQHPRLQAFYDKNGSPNTTVIEPYYEIQYEEFALGWYLTPVWDPQAIQVGVCLMALFDVHDRQFSQTKGNCIISILAAPASRTVDIELHCEIVSDFSDRAIRTLEMIFWPGDSQCIEGMAGDWYYEYRVVYPGSWP